MEEVEKSHELGVVVSRRISPTTTYDIDFDNEIFDGVDMLDIWFDKVVKDRDLSPMQQRR